MDEFYIVASRKSGGTLKPRKNLPPDYSHLEYKNLCSYCRADKFYKDGNLFACGSCNEIVKFVMLTKTWPKWKYVNSKMGAGT